MTRKKVQRRMHEESMVRVHPVYFKHLRELEEAAIERGEASATDWEKESYCGFTRADVDFLRYHAEARRAENGPYEAAAIEFDELADRIAALLPPRDAESNTA